MVQKTTKDVACPGCHGQMAKQGTINAGNSSYDEFVCKGCHQRKMVCTGMSRLTTF